MKAYAAYRLPTLLALSLALSACAIGPDYQRPPLQTPAQFKQIEGWTQAKPGDVLERVQDYLRDGHDISHVTVQLEGEACPQGCVTR
mgnify:CR=1 FL=1